jgi:hypothetical protein
MSVAVADKDPRHLFPVFREKLLRVLQELEAALGEPWMIVEGYRSQERQSWLYAQGRTRPGRIVTWMRTPKWHGTGLAADCIPRGRGYGAPMSWWERYRAIYHAHGLNNPAWGNGDLGHVQLSDDAMRARSLVWVRAGFPALSGASTPPAAGGIRVVVGGERVEDADAYLDEGRVWAKLRPVTDALDLVIAAVRGSGTTREAVVIDDTHEWVVPVVLRQGRAFARVRDIPARLRWDPSTQTALLDPSS